MRKLFGIVAGVTGSLLALAIIALLVATAIGVKINLEGLKPAVEASLQKALGRKVSIDGPVEFELSLWPALSLSGLSIANVEGRRQADFLRAEQAQLKLAIPSLLGGELVIVDVIASGVTLNLESDADGVPNWVFADPQHVPAEVPEAATDDTSNGDPLITFTGLDNLSLEAISINYYDAAIDRHVTFSLNALSGSAATDEPIVLDFNGKVQDKRYDLTLEGSSLRELIDAEQPWSFELKGEAFEREMLARGKLRLQGEEPQMSLAFGMRDVNVGAILQALGLVEGLDASLGDAGFKVDLKGDSLQEVLHQSQMAFTVRGGSWQVQLPSADAAFAIDNLYGDIEVKRGNNVRMKLDGTIDGTPVNLNITGSPLVEYVKNQEEIPLAIDARLLASRIHFDAVVQLPTTIGSAWLSLDVQSERIDRFNELLRLDLPPLGPVSLQSQLHIRRGAYELNELHLSVADSRLDGQASVNLSGDKPRLEATLRSELIQLDDFAVAKTEDSADTEQPATPDEEQDNEISEQERGQRREDLLDLLSYDALNAFDAQLLIEAQAVRSGEDLLGAARLDGSLEDARLAIEPLVVDLPGGSLELNADYQPSPSDVTLNVYADIEQFDISMLVHRARPDSAMGGRFTLDAELHARAPNLSSTMAHASGHIDFALVPENFSSGVIDLWAVNLLSAIMSKSTEKDDSQVNCVVMRFAMEDGLMQDKAIFMDTTAMQVSGESEIDFRSEELSITMSPEPKRPEFYSMALPIEVRGSFEDFGLKLNAARTTGQVIEFITSPLHVPIRRAMAEDIPADGAAACKAAWEAEPRQQADSPEEGAAAPGN